VTRPPRSGLEILTHLSTFMLNLVRQRLSPAAGGTMFPCPKCKTEIPSGENYCPQCFEQLEPPPRPSWWRRLLHKLFGPRPVQYQVGSSGICKIELLDPATGQRKQADSLTQLPPNLRPQLEELCRQALPGEAKGTYVFQDFAGQKHTYHSLEEMPPELRSFFEQARRLAVKDIGKNEPAKRGE
jgi:hypothetical protein